MYCRTEKVAAPRARRQHAIILLFPSSVFRNPHPSPIKLRETRAQIPLSAGRKPRFDPPPANSPRSFSSLRPPRAPIDRGRMSFQDLEAGHVRGAPVGGRRNGRAAAEGGAGAGASQAVASGVFQINTAVATFQRLVNTLGTPKDTPDLRDRIHKTRAHITQLVKDTSEKLKQASEADHRVEVSASKKIADAKLAKDFQAVLKEFQKAQRLAVEREAAYAPFISQAGLPQSYNSSEVNNTADRLAEQRTQLLESRRQELVFLDNEIVFNEAIIEERDQGIQEIQHQITEVNEIFKDLAVLVHDQGAMIDDIDSHIENAVAATAQAKGQLSKAAKTQKSNSSLICLLLVIFGVVLLIVIIVLAA